MPVCAEAPLPPICQECGREHAFFQCCPDGRWRCPVCCPPEREECFVNLGPGQTFTREPSRPETRIVYAGGLDHETGSWGELILRTTVHPDTDPESLRRQISWGLWAREPYPSDPLPFVQDLRDRQRGALTALVFLAVIAIAWWLSAT